MRDYTERAHLERDELWLIWSPGFPEELRLPVEQSTRSCGFQKITWVKTGGVITAHSGPSAFGVVGFSAKKEKIYELMFLKQFSSNSQTLPV